MTRCGSSRHFATLDLLSGGRAEIMAGRGSFIESFPLFGYDLDDYDELFAEKLDLLLALRDSERVTWAGRHRPPLDDLGVYPRPLQDPLPIWIAVGGTPAVGRPRRHARAAAGARDHRRRPSGSRRSSTCTARPPGWPGTTRPLRSASTRTATSPTTSQQAADEAFSAVQAPMMTGSGASAAGRR